MLNLTLIFYFIYLLWSVVIVEIYWHTTVGTPNFQNGQCMPALVIFSLYGLVLPKCTMMGFILKMIQLYMAIVQILTRPPSSPPMPLSFLDLHASLYWYLTYSLIELKLK